MPTRTRILPLAIAAACLAAALPAAAHLSMIRQGAESTDLAQDGDALGRAVAGGDFNGDGYQDVASAAPDESNGLIEQAVQGLVVINYGSATGPLPDQADEVTVGDVPDSAVRFGRSLAVGRFNADAYDDLAVGAPEMDYLSVVDAGAVFIFHGGPQGLNSVPAIVLYQTAVNAAIETDDMFGWSLAAADFDQDGRDDLAIGSLGENNEAGCVSWIKGSAAGLVPGSGATWAQNELGLPSLANDWFGYALATGDFDGNGKPDLAAGAPHKEIGSSPVLVDAGRVYILFSLVGGLTTWAAVYDAASIDMDPQESADFGFSLAAGVFFAVDGADDLAIGEPRANSTFATDRGRVVCLDFDPETLPVNPAANIIPWPPTDRQWIQQGVNGTADGGEAFDRFGWSLAAGDFDDDGFDDVGVGVPDEDLFLNDAEGTPQNCGMTHVFYGASGGPSYSRVDTFTPITQMDFAVTGDAFGQALAFARCDDSGRASLVVGVPGKDYLSYSGGANVSNAGAVHVVAPWRQPSIGGSRRASVALDCDGGIVYSQRPYDRLRPASTTKTLTLLLSCEALAANVVDMDDVYTVPGWVATNVGGSQMNLYTGEQITFGDLMKGMMTVSGNDAAYALGDMITGGNHPWGGGYSTTMPAFQAMMNARAAQLGMTLTTMTNPPGLDSGNHYTTALDFARLARAAMQNDCVRDIVGTSPWMNTPTPNSTPPWTPPHCPNPNCPFHNPLAQRLALYRRCGYHLRRSPPYRVPRFQCRHCRRTFSSQTFCTSYWLKRPELLPSRLPGHLQRHGQPSDRPHLPAAPRRPSTTSSPASAATACSFSDTLPSRRHRQATSAIDGLVSFEYSASTTPSSTSSPWTTTPASCCTSPTRRCGARPDDGPPEGAVARSSRPSSADLIPRRREGGSRGGPPGAAGSQDGGRAQRPAPGVPAGAAAS